MSFKAMAWATEQEITKTSPQSHLLLIMASFANEQNECYPSISTIEKKTRLSHNTIRKCIKELIDFGLVVDTKKTSQFNTKIYQLNLDCVGAIESNLNDTPTNFGSTTNFDTPTNFGMTPLPNLNDTPTKFGAKPLPNLVDNPINNPININHKETCHSETYTRENQNFENSQNPISKKSQSVDNGILEKSKSKTTKPKITYEPPIDLKPTEKQITKCLENGLNANDEFDSFVNWALANGKGYANWSMGFNTWINNSINFKSSKPQSKNREAEFAELKNAWGHGFYDRNKQQQIGLTHE